MKHFLSTNCAASSLTVNGKDIDFIPAVYMIATRSEWGTYSTDDPAEIEALTSTKEKPVPYVTEIDEADLAKYEAQRKSHKDYSTIIVVQRQGISSDPKGGVAAVVVDEPAPSTTPAVLESADEVLATKVGSKKAR